jgi:tetratricopeptide (TPR) repeat protein
MSTQYLIIRHLGERQFAVTRLEDGKQSAPIRLTGPDELTVPGRQSSHLLDDLRWYLERFLDYPFEPRITVAEQVWRGVEEWGQSTFQQLFTGQPHLWFDRIRATGLENLVLKIASDDPKILAWPWEALRDPHGTTLAHTCRIERQLANLNDPQPLPTSLSSSEVNVLLVIARPFADEDVGFHAISGPIVEWVGREKVPVRIEVLRPPTFTALQQCLAARPGFFHVLHFDGHGSGAPVDAEISRYQFGTDGGCLIFENEDGGTDEVSAHKLTALLTEHRIPIVLLNACRSAEMNARWDDPFASVAAALLKAGVRSVVAMSYSLYVAGAQQFVPAFYKQLIASGDVGEATRAGRKAMLQHDARACPRGEHSLHDWLVPVLYQQEIVPLKMQPGATPGARPPTVPDPSQQLGDYGFIGRQDAIHRLERAVMRQPSGGVLVHGLVGSGKTMLARAFLRWLEQTGGFREAHDETASTSLFVRALWLQFDVIRSAEFVVNQLTEACFGFEATALTLGQKLPRLIRALREQPLLVVWDNFESVSAGDSATGMPLLPEADRNLLKDLLAQLRGGRSKVLITSRSPEDWLNVTEVYRIRLGGLKGEDAWTYCNAVVRDLGLKLQRDDPHLVQLIQELHGNPLALRALLLRSDGTPAADLLTRFKQALASRTVDESLRPIFAALDLLNRDFPERFVPVLQLIGLHKRYLAHGLAEQILHASQCGATPSDLNDCLAVLERAGLIHRNPGNVYTIHLALSGFLETTHVAQESTARIFVIVMGMCAEILSKKEAGEQRELIAIHGGNLQQALSLARTLDIGDAVCALTQMLAVVALEWREFTLATRLYEELAAAFVKRADGGEATAYHQLGVVELEQRRFAAAEQWSRKSLEISEARGDERGAAASLFQLGRIADEQRDFATAEQHFRKSLGLRERIGDALGIADSQNQLGTLALEQRDLAAAEQWCRMALETYTKHGYGDEAFGAYHQLGVIAQECGDLSAARPCFLQSVAISEKLGKPHAAASTYHQLGRIDEDQGDFTAAERWYLRALAIKEMSGDEHGAAQTYHQLGRIAEAQEELDTAGRWYAKALATFVSHGDDHRQGITSHQLGRVAHKLRDFPTAVDWYTKSLELRQKNGDDYGQAISYHHIGLSAHEQGDFASAESAYLNSLAIAERLGDEHRISATRYQLGMLAHDRRDFDAAERWYLSALALEEKHGDERDIASTYNRLSLLAHDRGNVVAAVYWHSKSVAIGTKRSA